MSYKYETQNAIYQYIKAYIIEYEHAPSMREIASVIGLKSASTVQFHLKNLEKQGKIILTGNPASIQLPSSDESEITESSCQGSPGSLIPVYSALPSSDLPYGTQIGQVAYSTLEPINKCFAFRMSGEAMLQDGILPDDIVIVSTLAETLNRCKVATIYSGGVTVRNLLKTSTSCKLVSPNPDYPVISGNSCTILGKVIGVVRRY